MTREAFARQVATKVGLGELAMARALGYDDVAAYDKSFRAGNETYASVHAEDRQLVTMGLRKTGRLAVFGK